MDLQLADKRVLVTGGCDSLKCDSVRLSSEIYDPESNQWAPTGPLASGRAGHTATLLPEGDVIVVGGCREASCRPTLDSTERWSPSTGTFAASGKMHAPRHDHTASLLPDGTVVVAGSACVGRWIIGRAIARRDIAAMIRYDAPAHPGPRPSRRVPFQRTVRIAWWHPPWSRFEGGKGRRRAARHRICPRRRGFVDHSASRLRRGIPRDGAAGPWSGPCRTGAVMAPWPWTVAICMAVRTTGRRSHAAGNRTGGD